jgi:NADH-quinone oxidoreductase subunit N
VSLNDVLHDLGPSLAGFRPELTLCATMVLLLLVRMLMPRWQAGAYYVMLFGTAAALYAAIDWPGFAVRLPPQPLFTGLLVLDSFSAWLRVLLLSFALLFTGFVRASGVPHPGDATDFYLMVLGATLGMCLMVSANHVLLVFLGIEMASVPSYVLAATQRERREASEAALKYAVFGGAAAGVMLYGISLVAGALGSAHLPTMAHRLAGPEGHAMTGVLVLGGLMWMVGLAFKLSAVPFHFWLPDVFEGAPAEVGAFLSIASKAAAVGLLVRLALVFSGSEGSLDAAALGSARLFLGGLIGLLAAVTCTFGNLAAYGQTNMKRLLAYSTIAHAGYMMMPVAAAVTLAGSDPVRARAAVAAVVVYLAVYLFMNFGAFAFVAFLRNATGGESLADYAGLVRRSPGLAIAMTVILFSLVGVPPLAGFSAKFGAFAALWDARLLALLLIGALNTVLSLFYYLRVVRMMLLVPEPADRPAPAIPLGSVAGAYIGLAAAAMLVLFFCWGWLWNMGLTAAASLLQ